VKALAVDLGGSHVTCALVENATILDSRTMSIDSGLGLGPILRRLGKTLAALRGQSNADIAGLALGFCGLVDSTRNRILATNGARTCRHRC
jgi:glucokinase